MAKAARAIIVEGEKMLVMHRNKQGSEYFTLVGGRAAEGETTEQALIREVREETGLNITDARLVFTEDHQEPYDQQYIYLCTIAPYSSMGLQVYSEEYRMNSQNLNTHTPLWVSTASFERLPFRTPNLHAAIIYSLPKGFPPQPVNLTGNSYYAREIQSWHKGASGLPKRLIRKIKGR